jgi:hypothetical protein
VVRTALNARVSEICYRHQDTRGRIVSVRLSTDNVEVAVDGTALNGLVVELPGQAPGPQPQIWQKRGEPQTIRFELKEHSGKVGVGTSASLRCAPRDHRSHRVDGRARADHYILGAVAEGGPPPGPPAVPGARGVDGEPGISGFGIPGDAGARPGTMPPD